VRQPRLDLVAVEVEGFDLVLGRKFPRLFSAGLVLLLKTEVAILILSQKWQKFGESKYC
jgi:hypothetical protein